MRQICKPAPKYWCGRRETELLYNSSIIPIGCPEQNRRFVGRFVASEIFLAHASAIGDLAAYIRSALKSARSAKGALEDIMCIQNCPECGKLRNKGGQCELRVETGRELASIALWSNSLVAR
jgi:hypothetical protein